MRVHKEILADEMLEREHSLNDSNNHHPPRKWLCGGAGGKVATWGRGRPAGRPANDIPACGARVRLLTSSLVFTTSRMIYVICGAKPTLAVRQRSAVGAATSQTC
jgi:hypothetical protein